MATLRKLTSWLVLTDDDVEAVRRIYNATIDDLSTHWLKPRTAEEQQEWWKSLDHKNRTLWLIGFHEEHGLQSAAFVMLTKRTRDFHSVMMAVHPDFQRQGVGLMALRFYLSVAPAALVATDLVANTRVTDLNDMNGWDVLAVQDGVRFLVHTNKLEPTAELRERAREYHRHANPPLR